MALNRLKRPLSHDLAFDDPILGNEARLNEVPFNQESTLKRGTLTVLWKAIVLKSIAVSVATCLWLPSMHLFFSVETKEYRQSVGVAPKARQLAERHLAIWRDPVLRARELESMQKVNPEWDFMSRTYFVLALANMALRDPAYEDLACEIIELEKLPQPRPRPLRPD